MDKIECTNCNKLVSSKNLLRHQKTPRCINYDKNKNNNNNSIQCNICNKTISNKFRLKEHQKSVSCKSNNIDTNFLELKRKQMIWWEKIQKIQIIDWENYDIYEYGINNGKIYTKNRMQIGYYKDWEDTSNLIDNKFKNKENYVIDNNTGEILQKFIIDNQIQVFQIKLGTYSKFRYDYEEDRLIFSDVVRYIY